MAVLTPEEEYLAKYYDETLFAFEAERLEKHGPVEYAITCRYLDIYTPQVAIVADVGVGVGHYAEFLTRRGCTVYLIDLSTKLLRAAQTRLERAGLGQQIQRLHRASATDLSCLENESCDSMLMLGPLYHLQRLSERRRAVKEAWRVLKPNGLLFAAGINRLAYFRDLFVENPRIVVERKEFHNAFLQEGRLDPEHAPPLGYAHLTTVAEFRELFAGSFEELALTGTESFTTVRQSQLHDLPVEEREAWLDLVFETGRTPEGLGQSDHFLFVGRKLIPA
jgi:S-adenosylmethionine-dependent methyltransferase